MRRRRRRLRIQRHEEETPIHQPAASRASVPATAVFEHDEDTPETGFGDLNPKQLFVLNMQQNSGNQAVMRYIQRAKDDRAGAEAVSDDPAVVEDVTSKNEEDA